MRIAQGKAAMIITSIFFIALVLTSVGVHFDLPGFTHSM